MAVHLPPGTDARRDLVCYSAPNIDPDPLKHVLRSGAARLLAEAIEAEVEAFVAAHADLADENGHRRVVRHGYQPAREVKTGIGAVAVRRPRVRDRHPDATDRRANLYRHLRHLRYSAMTSCLQDHERFRRMAPALGLSTPAVSPGRMTNAVIPS